jgi:hypothetical protein
VRDNVFHMMVILHDVRSHDAEGRAQRALSVWQRQEI